MMQRLGLCWFYHMGSSDYSIGKKEGFIRDVVLAGVSTFSGIDHFQSKDRYKIK